MSAYPDGITVAAQLMELAARTAPKTAGKDFVVTRIISSNDLARLADAMVAYGRESGKKDFDRDGENVRQSATVLLIGLQAPKTSGLNCGACGNPKCSQLPAAHEGPEFAGPWCAWRLVDLGIALGSAVKMASLLNVDNRIMYRIGLVARRLGLLEADVLVGIPLSATGKNIYFDRGK